MYSCSHTNCVKRKIIFLSVQNWGGKKVIKITRGPKWEKVRWLFSDENRRWRRSSGRQTIPITRSLYHGGKTNNLLWKMSFFSWRNFFAFFFLIENWELNEIRRLPKSFLFSAHVEKLPFPDSTWKTFFSCLPVSSIAFQALFESLFFRVVVFEGPSCQFLNSAFYARAKIVGWCVCSRRRDIFRGANGTLRKIAVLFSSWVARKCWVKPE